MHRFLYRFLITILPIVFWGVAILIIDPFNYFGNNFIRKKHKKNAENLNTLVCRSIQYTHAPAENLFIGDSRTALLSSEVAGDITGEEWKELIADAGKLNEIIELFYLAHERKKLKRVVIGVNFSLFNKYSYGNRIKGLKKMLNNPLVYLYNYSVSEAAYYTLTSIFQEQEISTTPPMINENFWRWNISTKTRHWYERYAYPETSALALKKLDQFARNEGIELILINIPHHIEAQERLQDFNLQAEELAYKNFLTSLHAEVIDYDYPNEITQDKSNYTDPFHFTKAIGDSITKEVLTHELRIGKPL